MSTPLESASILRHRILVTGIVQGVGFRPFVYHLAQELALDGCVSNGPEGVVIEIEGPRERLELFRAQLCADAPPLARIDSCQISPLPAIGADRFEIVASQIGERAVTHIAPDVAVCADCQNELFDPSDRRYRYPFINCTNCGPRFTIVEGIPYDRHRTTMKQFDMCPRCAEEYHDPTNRRFHAQPNACPACGPKIWLQNRNGSVECDDPITAAVRLIKEGRILAIRGVGGFHLTVDAANDAAVRELRRRKHRSEKPFAMMAPDVAAIRSFCFVSADEEHLLVHRTSPIVLLGARETELIAPAVTFGSRYFGFMLPYTPLHHLLFRGNFPALVMTSGNMSDEPIAIDNDEALEQLTELADCFLLHNRDICQRADDSIVISAAGSERIIRRSRGHVPGPVSLSYRFANSVLACGGELKNCIALTRDRHVYLSQYIGDLDNPAALDFFASTIRYLQRILEIRPTVIACDLHPDYLSTRWAREQRDLPVVAVQHHHAHLVSVLAENDSLEPAIGIVLDGTGYGTDGTVWGGEVLYGDAAGFDRFAWLEPVLMPGVTAAIKQPWRMGLSFLYHAYGDDYSQASVPLFQELSKDDINIVTQMMQRRLHCVATSSCGRLFDGVSAILGLRYLINYEAQAAIDLEKAAALAIRSGCCLSSDLIEFTAGRQDGGNIPVSDLIRAVVTTSSRNRPVCEIAAGFHAGLADLFVAAALSARDRYRCNRVALSGGVYQNVLFFEYMIRRLHEHGFDVLTHRLVPTNDGGIALGQAVAADMMARAENL